ncbi:PREDICTED: uncharacterized protein LOC106806397 [Priapulus caudatus]|uniref:Uncharacterized protein LOC106806397 n=1 Tax=Priapulus caudatus TaxID=37621 RepID=A0ABM1DV36_PRICU|nr:PREDICTED: uncharacterized protein LOC106806397 [Priapulus caudatus]
MEAEEEEVPMEIADADATEDAGDECYSITSEMKAVEAALQDVIDSPHDNDKREWLFDRILRVKVKRENQLQQVISDNRQLTKEIARLRASTGRRRGGGGATPPAAPPDNDVQQQQQQQDWERVTERLQAENQSLVAENTRLQAAVAEMAETIEHLSVAAGNARSNGDA